MNAKLLIENLHQQRSLLMQELFALFPVVPGAFREVFRRCGKPTCWCAQSQRGHPLKRITWTEDGVSKSKAVSDETIDWFIISTSNRRQFIQIRAQLRTIDEQIDNLWSEYAKSQYEKSRMDLDRYEKMQKSS